MFHDRAIINYGFGSAAASDGVYDTVGPGTELSSTSPVSGSILSTMSFSAVLQKIKQIN